MLLKVANFQNLAKNNFKKGNMLSKILSFFLKKITKKLIEFFLVKNQGRFQFKPMCYHISIVYPILGECHANAY
jgi:hypothetical protein